MENQALSNAVAAATLINYLSDEMVKAMERASKAERAAEQACREQGLRCAEQQEVEQQNARLTEEVARLRAYAARLLDILKIHMIDPNTGEQSPFAK